MTALHPTRRTLLIGAGTFAVGLSPLMKGLTGNDPSPFVLFDNDLPQSRALAIHAPKRVSVGEQDIVRQWQNLMADQAGQFGVAGLTSWATFVMVRELGHDAGLRLRHEVRHDLDDIGRVRHTVRIGGADLGRGLDAHADDWIAGLAGLLAIPFRLSPPPSIAQKPSRALFSWSMR